MESARRFMIDQLRIPENKERAWEQFIVGVADFMEGKPIIGSKRIRSGVMNLASKDPVRALKGATFNVHLGWFNVRQLYVQAQNASLALSMYPSHAPTALPKAMALRSAILIQNGEARSSALIKAGKLFNICNHVIWFLTKLKIECMSPS